jgi:hypothetical protein
VLKTYLLIVPPDKNMNGGSIVVFKAIIRIGDLNYSVFIHLFLVFFPFKTVIKKCDTYYADTE